MTEFLCAYMDGALISMLIAAVCFWASKLSLSNSVKYTLIVGACWPVVWILCLYMLLKGDNKK